MAGWLSALKRVPWVEVAKNAPQIAEGARRLWQTVSRGKATPTPTAQPQTSVSPTDPLSACQHRVAVLEQELAEATALIHSLAEQDKQLVVQLDRLQQRTLWLTRVVAVLAVVVMAMAWRAG